MPKPPKKFTTDAETRHLVDEYSPYMTRLYVPVGPTRGVIRALLDQIDMPHLNREAAEAHLMAELLHDNREMEVAIEQSKDRSTEDQSAEENAQAEQFLTSEVLATLGERRVSKVLKEYSSHSVDRMRQESDEVLDAIRSLPSGNRNSRINWLNESMPQILESLKRRHACFLGCPANSEWPPKDENYLQTLLSPPSGMGPAATKQAILAYFHGLSYPRTAFYLEGQSPKTQSRATSLQK
jgi:hypothetical protein